MDGPEQKMLDWMERPQVMVRELWPGTVPDAWQDEALALFPNNPRLALKASKGPGKTATLAWIAWNYLLTRPHPNILATSISGDNLKANLWKEMAVWMNRNPMLKDLFEITSTKIVRKAAPKTWFMEGRTWAKSADKEQLAATLAGFHQDYMLFLLDETGAMPVEILLSAEAGFSSAKECHIVMAGNTNSLSGALYHGCVKQGQMWKVVVINGDPENPLRSPRISESWVREQIAAYGRDNPFIKVSILGEWPAASFNSLIGPDEVEEAMRRHYPEFQYMNASKIMGVDVARFGGAASPICKRQGIVVFPFITLRGVDSLQGAGRVVREWNDWQADACFIDATGGFGAGWIDQCRALGKTPIGVQYAGEAHNKARYYNKRTEMYFDAVEWVKRGGALPHQPEVIAALTETLYTFKGDRLLLEPKEEVAEKLGYSPDHCDSFVQTFAEPVQGRSAAEQTRQNRPSRQLPSHDPFRDVFDSMDKNGY